MEKTVKIPIMKIGSLKERETHLKNAAMSYDLEVCF